jgi:hypothetical protein
MVDQAGGVVKNKIDLLDGIIARESQVLGHAPLARRDRAR